MKAEFIEKRHTGILAKCPKCKIKISVLHHCRGFMRTFGTYVSEVLLSICLLNPCSGENIISHHPSFKINYCKERKYVQMRKMSQFYI